MEEKEYKPRDKEIVSFTMSHIKGKDTKIEIALRKRLWEKGYHYRKNDKSIFGHPDLSFKKEKVVVFADSEFWHGYNFEEANKKIKANRPYWINKIERNIQRDKEVNQRLKEEGYEILRFWGFEINKNIDEVIDKIIKTIEERRNIIKKKENLIKTTLAYIERDDKYLFIYRNKKKDDFNEGKYLGIGGHVEKDELPIQAAYREIEEETGLKIDKLTYKGYIDFINSIYPSERMYLYKGYTNESNLKECDEGELVWIEKDKIDTLSLWEGDKAFLPLLDKGGIFHISLIYEGKKLAKIYTNF